MDRTTHLSKPVLCIIAILAAFLQGCACGNQPHPILTGETGGTDTGTSVGNGGSSGTDTDIWVNVPLNDEDPPPACADTDNNTLWFTCMRLRALRVQAKTTNPTWVAFAEMADDALEDVESGIYPAADPGNCEGNIPVGNEERAMVLAFAAQLERNPAKSAAYRDAALVLFRYVNEREAQGVSGTNFECTTGIRTLFWGPYMAFTATLLVDTLTKDDYTAFVAASLLKADALNAHDGDYYPAKNLPNKDPGLFTRWGSNNFWGAYYLTMGSRALAARTLAKTLGIPADADMEATLDRALDAWLFATDHVLRMESVPGRWGEGTEYAVSGYGAYTQTHLSLHIAEENDTAKHGIWVDPTQNPFFNDFLRGFLFTRGPAKGIVKDFEWLGPKPLISSYGDVQKYPDVEQDLKFLGPQYEWALLNGDAEMAEGLRWVAWDTFDHDLEKMRWFVRDGLNSGNARNAIFVFAMLAENTDPPQDPRSAYPTTLVQTSPQGGVLNMTVLSGWDPEASFFTTDCSWRDIDHQEGSCGSVQLLLNGVWLTKNWDGYGAVATGATFGNALAIGNAQPSQNIASLYDDWLQGNQWEYSASGDPALFPALAADDYAIAAYDMTALYNAPGFNAGDVARATRLVFYMRQDHSIVILDHAKTDTPERFKRQWFNTPDIATVTGKTALAYAGTEAKVQLTSIYPPEAVVSTTTAPPAYVNAPYDQTAAGNQMEARILIEDPAQPMEAHYLTLIQGGLSNQSLDTALPLGVTGDWLGLEVSGWGIALPRDLYAPDFPLTVDMPASGVLYVWGLTPNGTYDTTVNDNGTVTVTMDGPLQADAAGLLGVTL